MSGFLEDENGNKSSKRLLQSVSTGAGILLAYIVTVYSISTGQGDIGSNTTLLVSMLVGAGIGGGVGTALSNKGSKS